MAESPDRPKIDVWEANGAGVERLAELIEGDRLPYSMAMGELLRSLYGLSQTLSGQQRGERRG
jgi:hypothetical protein